MSDANNKKTGGALCACERHLGPHRYADGGSITVLDPDPEAEELRLRRRFERSRQDAFARQAARRAGGDRSTGSLAGVGRAALGIGAGALRGATAATLGLPGDLESLGRAWLGPALRPEQGWMGATMSGLREHPRLPTSAFYRAALPTAGPGAAVDVGEAVGEFLPIPPAAARAVTAAGLRAARRGAGGALRAPSGLGRMTVADAERQAAEWRRLLEGPPRLSYAVGGLVPLAGRLAAGRAAVRAAGSPLMLDDDLEDAIDLACKRCAERDDDDEGDALDNAVDDACKRCVEWREGS